MQRPEMDSCERSDAVVEACRSTQTSGLDRRLRDYGSTVATRELQVALSRLEGLTPTQRRILAAMVGRIVTGVLAPARGVAEADGDGNAEARAVARLFDPERLRDRE